MNPRFHHLSSGGVAVDEDLADLLVATASAALSYCQNEIRLVDIPQRVTGTLRTSRRTETVDGVSGVRFTAEIVHGPRMSTFAFLLLPRRKPVLVGDVLDPGPEHLLT